MTYTPFLIMTTMFVILADFYIIINRDIVGDKILLFDPYQRGSVLPGTKDMDGLKMFELDLDITVINGFALAFLILSFVISIVATVETSSSSYTLIFTLGYIVSIVFQFIFIYSTTLIDAAIKGKQSNNMCPMLV